MRPTPGGRKRRLDKENHTKRSLLERPPPAPETRVRDPLGVMVRTRGGLTIIVEHVQTEPTDHFNMINWILTKCMGLGKKMSFSWKLLKWIYSVLEKSSSYIYIYILFVCILYYRVYTKSLGWEFLFKSRSNLYYQCWKTLFLFRILWKKFKELHLFEI